MSFDRLAWADRHDVDFVVRCTLVDTTVGAVTVVLVDVLDDQRPDLTFVPDDRAGLVIREARRRSGLSQAELARRAHVSQSVISAFESGRRESGLSMLAKLVEASGHTLGIDLVAEPATPRGLPDTLIGRRLRRRRRLGRSHCEER